MNNNNNNNNEIHKNHLQINRSEIPMDEKKISSDEIDEKKKLDKEFFPKKT